ncbi:hypothetical protein D3Z52_13550 [Clostridiaceae bacterium]|nr:hypothetical protein [Clostridiaceae bacterium]
MDKLFNSCPPMDFGALEEEILVGVLRDDNYLFYRTGFPDPGWPVEPETACWELYCTACHQQAFQPKRRGFKPSALEYCPECGAKVEPKRWQRRKNLRTRILFWKFQRGEGRQIWLRAYQATHSFCPEPGDEALYLFEAARYLFDDGAAHKWSHTMAYFGREHKAAWRKRARVTGYAWHVNPMRSCGDYPAYYGEVSSDFFRGSCLEYGQLEQASAAGYNLPEYLDFYVRNPMIEYLWKFGLSGLLWEALVVGWRADFRKAVNLKAKKPSGLLSGMTAAEARELARNQPSCSLAITYQRLKKEGAVHNSPECWTWARAVNDYPETAALAQEAHGAGGRALRAYIERQAKRSGHAVRAALADYGDYLRQLGQIGGGEVLPDDLTLAHERLSMRLGKVQDMALNRKFRARRHLYGWLCWKKGGFLIRPVDSVQEITREGEQQCNCVAGYAQRHADGNTVICVLRRASEPQKSWHTVELDPRSLTVRQCRGFRNADAEPEAQAFVDAWKAHLQEVRFGRKTT